MDLHELSLGGLADLEEPGRRRDRPAWPVGTGGAKSAGVAALVKQLNGSIGYVEYTYAQQNNISTVKMMNAAGKVSPPAWPASRRPPRTPPGTRLRASPRRSSNEPGATAWPITGATFALMQKSQTDAATAQTVLKFFDWGYKSGGTQAQSLNYVPIPAKVYNVVEQQWSQITVRRHGRCGLPDQRDRRRPAAGPDGPAAAPAYR